MTVVSEYCSVVLDNSCTAPPNIEDGAKTQAECFACGLPACLSCTVVTPWFDYGPKRVCANCLTQNGQGELVARLAWKNAGYKGDPPKDVVDSFTS